MDSNSAVVKEIGGDVAMEVRLGAVYSMDGFIQLVATELEKRYPDMTPEDGALDWFSIMVGASAWEAVLRFEKDEEL